MTLENSAVCSKRDIARVIVYGVGIETVTRGDWLWIKAESSEYSENEKRRALRLRSG